MNAIERFKQTGVIEPGAQAEIARWIASNQGEDGE